MPDEDILKELSDKIDYLRRSLELYRMWLEDAQTSLKYWEEFTPRGSRRDWSYSIAFSDVMAEYTIEKFAQILVNEAIKALSQSVEYNQPVFINGLLAACSDVTCIAISRDSKNFKVIIDLNITAGNLNQWGEAVKAVRKNMNMGKAPANIASKMFAEKYFGVDVLGNTITRTRTNKKTGETISKDVTANYKGKYIATIQQRLNESGALAPWWMLLNYGSPSFKLSSDRGGYSELTTPQTLFIQKAQTIIEGIITSNFPKKLKEWDDSCKKHIREDEANINKLEESIEEIIRKLEELSVEDLKAKIRSQLEKFKQLERTDPAKIDFLATQLLAGEKITRIRLGHGVRIRTVRIMQELRREMGR